MKINHFTDYELEAFAITSSQKKPHTKFSEHISECDYCLERFKDVGHKNKLKDIVTPSLIIRDTGKIGRGVYAPRDYNKKDLVEEAPVIVISSIEHSKLPQEIKERTFGWDWLAYNARCEVEAIALGCGSIYNHANPSNMIYKADRNNLLLRFIAVRDIKQGEELTINYNSDGGGHLSVKGDGDWFDRQGIKLES